MSSVSGLGFKLQLFSTRLRNYTATMEESTAISTSTPNSTSCWSNVVKGQPPPRPRPLSSMSTSQVFVESCNSTKGISIAVVDANAFIQGGEKLATCADKFVTVSKVLDEVRDPMSRHRLAFIPFSLESMEPSCEAMNKVTKFARATGDLQTLSEVDLKLIALTYMLEEQIHGSKHLRDCPPPVHTVKATRLHEKDMPGWGSNVPNLEEWEALEHEVENPPSSKSRIIPLQDLNLNVISSDDISVDGSQECKDEGLSENHDDTESDLMKNRRFPPKKKEINIEGKMVANGIDASQGEHDDDNGNWMPAVSRSTHRRYLKRQARREYYKALSDKDGQKDTEGNDTSIISEDIIEDNSPNGITEEFHLENRTIGESQFTDRSNGNKNLLESLNQMRLEENPSNHITKEERSDYSTVVVRSDHLNIVGDDDASNKGVDQVEVSIQTNESVEASFVDEVSSEDSWMLRSLTESSVACITSDFAMQNVILQMGLRLLAPGGMQIRQLQRWVLKCHACYTVTSEIGKIFCPKCGNGGTLRKVAVTVGENGIVLADRKPRVILRGTKFSLPSPQGGRDAITKNLILREDQIPQKFLHPKTKKNSNKQEEDLFIPGDIFSSHHADKRAPLQPPLRKALAVFSGKRNPNDNHYSRSKHK